MGLGPIDVLRGRVVAAWRGHAVSIKAMSFAMVGVMNTVADATVFFLLLEYLTSSLVVANVGAWLTVILGSFVMNSLTTFSAETGGRPRLRHFPGFVLSGILAIAASTTALVITAYFIPVWTAKGAAILVSFAVNFSITHFFVFRQRTDTAETDERREIDSKVGS